MFKLTMKNFIVINYIKLGHVDYLELEMAKN